MVNPEREIQPFVVNLTGINSKMLCNAPKFCDIAKRIVEITKDCIIVAHNTSFDYRILKMEFKRLGFSYKRKTLCTIELSQLLIPNLKSYSLGKLVKSLGIPLSNRHRASGDAMATVKLFKFLLSKDLEKVILKKVIKVEQKAKISTTLHQIIEQLPLDTGVYYMHNNQGEIIYIGKSRNIKKRVTQHFTSNSPKSKKIQTFVTAVTYEKTGSELAALLKENEEIKANKPIFNRALRRTIFTHALYSFTDENGYINFKIDKTDSQKTPIITFSTEHNGKNFMLKAVEEYNLCQKLVGLYKTKVHCFRYAIKACLGACANKEPADSYNKRANALLSAYSYQNKNMLVVDRGRSVDEKSVYLIEDGRFKGMGFFNLNYQITNIDILRALITPMANSEDNRHIIQRYMRKNKHLKIITFNH